jgi:hypothetical protein
MMHGPWGGRGGTAAEHEVRDGAHGEGAHPAVGLGGHRPGPPAGLHAQEEDRHRPPRHILRHPRDGSLAGVSDSERDAGVAVHNRVDDSAAEAWSEFRSEHVESKDIKILNDGVVEDVAKVPNATRAVKAYDNSDNAYPGGLA